MSATTIHTRAAGTEVLGVNWNDRVITTIVAPYEQPALVEYRAQVWEEVFSRGAFDSLNGRDPQRIRVNREHDRSLTVGKVIRFDTRDPRGLIGEIRVAKTQRGDDSLGLAAERMLSASAGFSVDPRNGQILDPIRRVRRITHAYLDHVALTMAPAYEGAEVLAVRSAATSHLDHYRADPVMVWAAMRSDPIGVWAAHRRTRRA